MATIANEPIVLVPAGKIRCYIHDGVFRKETPEEHVRQRVARSLVDEYGYDRADIHIELSVKMASKRKAVDIAIFRPGKPHIQDNIFIIVEAKREDIRPTDRKEGIEQLKSYLSACINARWGLWVGSEMTALEKETDPERAKDDPFPIATDIPLKGDTEPKRLKFTDLAPAKEGLRSAFKRCHNYLHVNGNMGKEKAFFELLKLIFCKIHDEQESDGYLDFCVTPDERRSELGQRKLKTRIGKTFDMVKGRYPYIFPNKLEEIELDNRCLAYCVIELQKYSLLQTASDVKGEAYEEIVGVTSRRDHGAFFTPRNVCDMAVQMVMATYPSERRLKLRLLDPACGTGGFLRAALIELRRIIEVQEFAKYPTNSQKAEAAIEKRLKALCDSNIFGIDKLAELVRAAQMNLALHGDGSTNVYAANSLQPAGEWNENVRENIRIGKFDAVFTNPPFGSKLPIDDPHILDQFDLSEFEARAPRSAMPPEQLFVERCLDFLKPGGRMAIVLPDSILSNPGLAWLRRWVLQNAWIIASVDLPRETFAKSDTGTMTSVLIVQKFTPEECQLVAEVGHPPEYDIFMAIADKVGWDLRGQPVYMRTLEGEEILRKTSRVVTARNAYGDLVKVRRDDEEPIIDDHLPGITALFTEWLKHGKNQRWMNGQRAS